MVKYLVTLITPILLRAQAHIGHTEQEIYNFHKEIKFDKGKTDDGINYLMGKMPLGTFIYYFDQEGYTNFNLQVPYNSKCVNQQIAIYNEKYVPDGPRSWKAYLDSGYVMNITLFWDEELLKFIFKYEGN